ncbi:MAG: TIGR02757 family protein [Firmicutes bacterium]|nr:TIGR02757 family protein [Bacillota bacterium]
MGSRSASRVPDRATALHQLALTYEAPSALALDPISVPRSYASPWDREVTAWIAAHLAYGRVAPMLNAIGRAVAPLGQEPAQWLRSRTPAQARRDLHHALKGWVWRFHTSSDLVEWVLAWQRLDRESQRQGLEPHLAPRLDDASLSRFIHRLRRELPPSAGLRFSLPDPLEGSACKRWRMFLRWMVRPGWPDLGQWKTCCPADLVIPVDTHVARVSGLIGLSSRRSPDGRMAAEITAALREVDPNDPLRFDFALSHLGIMGHCPGSFQAPLCAPCPLTSLCRVRKAESRP